MLKDCKADVGINMIDVHIKLCVKTVGGAIMLDGCLFRYRSISDNNIDALEKGRLFFSTPSKFNDPYDTLIYANREEILNHVQFYIKTYMDEYCNEAIEEAKINPFGRAADVIARWHGCNKDEYYNAFLIALDNAICVLRKKLRNSVKVICFSEELDSILMWSHYADYHNGFLLAYKIADLRNAKIYDEKEVQINNSCVLSPVQYNNEKYDLTMELEDYLKKYGPDGTERNVVTFFPLTQSKLRKALLQKADVWSYEKEWRLIPKHMKLNGKSDLNYIEINPVAVVLGAECKEENRDVIKRICKKKKIDVYVSKLDEESLEYKLVI